MVSRDLCMYVIRGYTIFVWSNLFPRLFGRKRLERRLSLGDEGQKEESIVKRQMHYK